MNREDIVKEIKKLENKLKELDEEPKMFNLKKCFEDLFIVNGEINYELLKYGLGWMVDCLYKTKEECEKLGYITKDIWFD